MGWRDRLLSNLIKGADVQTLSALSNAVSTPAASNAMADIPAEWIRATYGPGQPIRPIARPEESNIPREIDYPISVNATIQPRTNYGLMPFDILRQAYENISEIKMCVQTLGRELTGFVPRLVDGEGNEKLGHPYEWLLQSPDRMTPWVVWLTRFLQSANVFDAGSIFMSQSHGQLQGLHYVDGSTLFVLLDEHGRIPMPNDRSEDTSIQQNYVTKLQKYLSENPGKPIPKTPAFVQTIKGTPFGWYSQDEIWYRPRFRRYNAPYGMSPIETAWSWVLIISNITGFELSHYREGNMPEGLLIGPENWSLAQIDAYEQALNARMSSGPAERNRVRAVPSGFKWQEMKKPEFPKVLYTQARDNIALSFGIPPSEFGSVPGAGLGGKGFGDMMQNTLFRMGILPVKVYIEDAFNEILLKFGVTDVKLELGMPTEIVDPEKHKQAVIDQFKSGLVTLNDALQEIGKDPVPGGDVRMQIAGGQVIIIDDYLKPEVKSVVEGEANAAQAQATIDTAITDNQTAEKILDNSSILSGKTISIPARSETERLTKAVDSLISEIRATMPYKPVEKRDGIVHPRALQGKFAPKASISTEQARAVGALLGVDWSRINIEQFRQGLEDEEEHEEVTGGDPKLIGQIALDHLNEDPEYYTHLKQMEESFEKGCGVEPDDDEYYGAPLAGNMTIEFPGALHANELQIVAMNPEGKSPRAGLWKPEGGELDVLIERVGGAQYLREEAAYLLDRALGFNLVPVAYVTDFNDERGAVVCYVKGAAPSENINEYDPAWIMRAGVLDYIMMQTDRHTGNYLTHPDDPKRPILIDNGLGFPVADFVQWSPFVEAVIGKEIPTDILADLRVLVGDSAIWKDIATLVGQAAADKALARAKELIDNGAVPVQTNASTLPDTQARSTADMPIGE